MRTKFKAWAEPYLNEHPEACLTNENLAELNDFALEVGSGKGDFLVSMAKKFPKWTLVGVEKNVTCSGITCKKLVESQLKNAKLIWNDISNLFQYIKDNSVRILYLNFSDPWPKKRHFKRRLTSEKFLEEYKRILAKDGMIIFKTDNTELFNYSLESLVDAGFKILDKTDNYDGLDEQDAVTEYESFFRAEGTPIHRVKVTYDK